MPSFDWCYSGQHDKCAREYKVHYIDPKTNKPVYTGAVRKCECPKRGCKCYVKKADRTKVRKTRKAKK